MSSSKLTAFQPIVAYGTNTGTNACSSTTTNFPDAYNFCKSNNILSDSYDKYGTMVLSSDPNYPFASSSIVAPSITYYLTRTTSTFLTSTFSTSTFDPIESKQTSVTSSDASSSQLSSFMSNWNNNTVPSKSYCAHKSWHGGCDHHIRPYSSFQATKSGHDIQDKGYGVNYSMPNSVVSSSTTKLPGVFMFNNLETAKQMIAKNIAIASYQSPGAVDKMYYTWDLMNIIVEKKSVLNPFNNNTPTYNEYKMKFDTAINNCNEATNAYNQHKPNLYGTNGAKYYNAIEAIREKNGLYIPSPSASTLYQAEGTIVPYSKKQCFLNPNQQPWFDPAMYGKTTDQLNTAAENCANITTLINNEGVNCCVNPNSLVTDKFDSCPDQSTPKSILGCNTGTNLQTIQTDGITPIIMGTPSQSYTAARYTEVEGFVTIGEDIQSLKSISQTQLNDVNATLLKIETPAVQASHASISTMNKEAESGIDIKENLLNTANTLKKTMSYDDINQTASVVRNDLYTNYNEATESINDCSTATSIVGVDASGQNYLVNGGTGCTDYQNAYTDATQTCSTAYSLAKQFNDANGAQKLSQITSNVANGIIGRTMEDANSTLESLNETCHSWATLYDQYLADEKRAAALPCQPSRPITNNFDSDISAIVSRWNTESTNYIKLLKQRLDNIYEYVQQYPPKFEIISSHVPNGTPNTPFISLQEPVGNNSITGSPIGTPNTSVGNDSTTSMNYTMKMYLPAGPKGLTGSVGISGVAGLTGPTGHAGTIGAPGIAELPIQYTPE
jgi:hypothetical protein